MGWCHGFKLHLLCNDSGEVITFCLTGSNMDDRDSRVWNVFTKVLYGKVFADRGYIKQELFESLFSQGIQLVHGLKAKMKNKLMPMWDKIMLRKRYIIECINELLKNKANLVHSRHRSIHNFIMNLCSALTAYCFFDNKPEALTCLCRKIKAVRTKCCIRILSRTRVYKGDSARIYVWFKFYRTAINLNLQLKRGVIPPLSAVLPSP